MRSKMTKALMLALVVAAGALNMGGCNDVVKEYTFDTGVEEWTDGFSDYPAGEEEFYELAFSHSALPAQAGSGNALFITGNNHSDDLFMFVKRKISGLTPNTLYQVTFTLEIASNAPDGSVGIGGSPANSVYVKAGVTLIEPKAVLGPTGDYQMNIDKGNQAIGGTDAIVLGDVAKLPGDETWDYALISRNNNGNPFSFSTDGTGEAWILVGTDSGFEGATSLYYSRIKVTFAN